MELGPELAQRRVQLGRQHEHRQRGLQSHVAVDQPDADDHRHERDTERRRELQHRAGQEGDPERPHGGAAVALSDGGEGGGLGPAAVVRAQRRQAAHDVEEVGREQAQRLPALAGALLGAASDQPHEDRHQRQRQEHHAGRQRIDPRHPGQHGDRHDGRQHELRQVAGEVRLEAVDALDARGRDLGRLGAVEGRRCVAQAPLGELDPEPGQRRRSSAPAGHLEAPPQHPAQRERHGEEHDVGRDIGRRGAVEGARDHRCEQRRLDQDQQRRAEPERDVGREQPAHRPRPPDEAPVERAHQPAVGAGSSGASVSVGGSEPSRARNTWYVQPW